jgi:hypothetical protein
VELICTFLTAVRAEVYPRFYRGFNSGSLTNLMLFGVTAIPIAIGTAISNLQGFVVFLFTFFLDEKSNKKIKGSTPEKFETLRFLFTHVPTLLNPKKPIRFAPATLPPKFSFLRTVLVLAHYDWFIKNDFKKSWNVKNHNG